MNHERTYLGDGLYASYDGYQIRLAASNGERDTNEVFLEPSVWKALERYVISIAASPQGDGADR